MLRLVVIVIGGHRRLGFGDGHLAQLLRVGQLLQPAQPKVLQKTLRRAISLRTPRRIGASNNLDEFAVHERPNDAIDGHAANFLHLRARDGLTIGNDGQRLQRRFRKTSRPILHADECAHPRREFRLRHVLPSARHAHQPIAAPERLHLRGERLQRVRHRLGLGGGVFLGAAFTVLAGVLQDVL